MAVTGMATRYKHPVSSVEKGLDYKKGINTTGTRDPDDPQGGGLFETAYPCSICSAI
jgi:hypothetical protein